MGTSYTRATKPQHLATDSNKRLVASLAAVGATFEFIAKEIGISTSTLNKHYKHELHSGKERANIAVAQTLYREATGMGSSKRPNVAAAIFWLKTQAGWRETMNVELKAIAAMSDDELRAAALDILTSCEVVDTEEFSSDASAESDPS